MRPAREEWGGLRDRDQIETSKEKEFRDKAKEGNQRGFIIDRNIKLKWEVGFPRELQTPGFWTESDMKTLMEEGLFIGGKKYS